MTIRSMTGFGRSRGRLSERVAAGVVVRSVNNKFLDIQVRLGGREEAPEAVAVVRAAVGEAIRRGRVTVQVNLERSGAQGGRVMVDGGAIRALLEQLNGLDLPPEACEPVSVGDVLAVPGLVTVESGEMTLDEGELARLGEVVRQAVAGMVAMREREGAATVAHLEEELGAVEAFVAWVEPLAGQVRDKLQERLRARLEELLGEGADEGRMLQEVAMLADRADVAEEIVRLKGHLQQFRRRLDDGGVVGRTLDFLCQEINRELNTLGSKMREALLTERLVDAKSAVERIREQVQNLE